MKLLLVDDERITREGLLSSIDWEALGIHAVLEAQDGAQALALAKKHAPQIVLTDIRMPHMDGVTFANRLQEILPDSSLIFMSGYSDKEYLRAAIRLKAVSYVEKPIDHEELTLAIAEAVKLHETKEHHRYTKYLQQQEKSAQLAMLLSRPLIKDLAEVEALLSNLHLSLDESSTFRTMLLKTMPHFSGAEDPRLQALLFELRTLCNLKSTDFLTAMKYDGILLLTLYGEMEEYREFYRILKEHLEPHCSYFLAVGPRVKGLSLCHESYNQAAVLMQRSFFCDYNTILTDVEDTPDGMQLIGKLYKEFCQGASQRDVQKATESADALYEKLRASASLLPSNVKDLYFKMFIALEQAYHMSLLAFDADSDSIWDGILSCNTLLELHKMLLDELKRLSLTAGKELKDSAPISFMKDYIHQHYMDPSLSVKDISDHANLSVPYACTIFKSETGKTVNQYLTEQRMEKAKQLLMDVRIRIADISTKVGYLDGNYFGKSFKKATGLSPSEYREKLLL